MPGIKAKRRLLLGREATGAQGTAVPATTTMRALGTIEDNQEMVFPEEDVGIIPGTDRSYVAKLEAGLPMEGEVTFEQIQHIFEAGIKEILTPTTDGTGNFIYSYDMPTTDERESTDLRVYTIEGGDNQAAEEMEFCFVRGFTLEGNQGEAMMFTADWVGRQVSTSAFTTGLSIPTVEEVLFTKALIYIDASSDAFGTSVKSNTVLSVSIDVDTGWRPIWTADGNLYFGFAKGTKPEITMDMTFEHDGTSVAEKANYKAQTPRNIRFEVEGSAFSDTDGAHLNKKFRVDLSGKWQSFEAIDEEDGNDTVTGSFMAKYNQTAAHYATFWLTNTLASVP